MAAWENDTFDHGHGAPPPGPVTITDAGRAAAANTAAFAAANQPRPPRGSRGRPQVGEGNVGTRPPPSAEMIRALQEGGHGDQRSLGYIAQGQIANPRANKHFSITIEHLPTNEEVTFDGWVTQFADNFTSQWNGTPVYGRMDDLYTFQRTGRKISIAFDVVAVDVKEGSLNQWKMNRLAQFLYPVYTDDAQPAFQVLSAAPLLRMKFSGLVQNSTNNQGLVGFLQGFSYAPSIEAGPMITGAPTGQSPNLIYKEHSIQLEFTVLHTHQTGWTKETANAGGTTYSFGGQGDAQAFVAKNFPHGIPEKFNVGAASTKADGSNPYVDALPMPQRSMASQMLGEQSSEQLARLREQQQRQAEQIAAQEQKVLQTAQNRQNRQNRRWNALHPNKPERLPVTGPPPSGTPGNGS
jgi:hypothetical protein